MFHNRKVIAVAASTALIFGLAGCSLNREIASLEVYAPSDGSQVDLIDARVRNLLIVQRNDGQAVLIGTLVNSSVLNSTSVELQLVDASGERITLNYDLEPASKYDIGYNGGEEVLLQLSERPGDLVSVFVTEGDLPKTMVVPVLDGTLAEYRQFVD